MEDGDLRPGQGGRGLVHFDQAVPRRPYGGQQARRVVSVLWAYRGRPVYTYVGDEYPGAVNGHGIGEFSGTRNGYHAFTLRDIFMNYEFRRP